ncbi:MAG: hypothetical protein MZW92_32875 [Comamonadaceae bacterium]|nr:hypothetical protein [Comamonadaceae bacterium]
MRPDEPVARIMTEAVVAIEVGSPGQRSPRLLLPVPDPPPAGGARRASSPAC